MRRELGRFVVVDTEICHGKPTFAGTRVMVWNVIEQVTEGMDWDEITREWRGRVPREAIEEAAQLVRVGILSSDGKRLREPVAG